ncbi:MAG: periplasmic heavy metal sensor [Candidatus Eisenbacteria bacterium]|nr:periplasmic heavy metal sensor [Candidatus Eisenbacteria bacterium]
MRSKRRITTIAVLALVGVALIALPAGAFRGRAGGMAMGKAPGMGMGPAFTDEQQEKIEKIHDNYNDERAELTNRLKVLMLEGQELMEADTPDFDAMESRIEEVAEVKVELAKLRLSIHKEIRPLLDDDQKVLFDRGLGRMLHGGMAGDRTCHPGMMGRSGMRGPSGGHPGMMMGRGGMGGGMPGRAGTDGRTGYRMMMWSPDVDNDSDE